MVSIIGTMTGGGFKHVLVIGADALSRYVDWTDQSSCVFFQGWCWGCAVTGRHPFLALQIKLPFLKVSLL